MRFRVAGQYVQASIAALAAVEFAIVAVAFYAAMHLRFRHDLSFLQDEVGAIGPRTLAFGLAILVALLAFGLYSPRQRARASGIVLRLIAAVACGTTLAAATFYFAPDVWVGRGVLALAATFALIALGATRLAFPRLLSDRIFKRRVLVYGCGNRALPISHLRRVADRRGFVIVGFVPVTGEPSLVGVERQLLSTGTLSQLSQEHCIDEIVVAVDDRRAHFPNVELIECRFEGITITEPLTFLERETGRVCVSEMEPSWIIFSHGFKRGALRVATARALDIAASAVLLAIVLPLSLLTVLAIKIEDGWAARVIYRQQRVGQFGKVFELLKFRSMRVDAEADGQARWAQLQDPRVTRVGSIIRRLRIDELPQILNVLAGDMGLVGPRPERPHFVAQLEKEIPYYAKRHCVKPGITGWAQLCYPYGASESDARRKLDYDLYYIKNNNILFDMSVLLQTAEVVLLGQGAADRMRRPVRAPDLPSERLSTEEP